jgi:hypothetical protein
MGYEERLIYVPVEKMVVGEYEIEHIVEYIPREVT